MQQLIVDLLEKIGTDKERYLTPRLEAAVLTVYEFKDEHGGVKFQLDPIRLVEDPQVPAHCTIAMEQREWKSIFSGESSLMTKVMAGKTGFLKHNRRQIMHLSMLMHAVTLGARK